MTIATYSHIATLQQAKIGGGLYRIASKTLGKIVGIIRRVVGGWRVEVMGQVVSAGTHRNSLVVEHINNTQDTEMIPSITPEELEQTMRDIVAGQRGWPRHALFCNGFINKFLATATLREWLDASIADLEEEADDNVGVDDAWTAEFRTCAAWVRSHWVNVVHAMLLIGDDLDQHFAFWCSIDHNYHTEVGRMLKRSNAKHNALPTALAEIVATYTDSPY